MFAWVKKKNKIRWNARGHFSKITETAHLSGMELSTDNSQYGSYITRLWKWMNSYWMFWIGGLSWRFSASSFCNFWKVTSCDFITFFLAYLCLNIINFGEMDFSERRSEEVISFFWRSVYVLCSCNVYFESFKFQLEYKVGTKHLAFEFMLLDVLFCCLFYFSLE